MWMIIAIGMWGPMTTIQMTLDENLLKEMDLTVKKLKTTRSALIRDSIRQYLKALNVRQLEEKHRAGYAKHPVKRGEFDVWESEQTWSE
jgi:metal-responsive CopG/Arc/MetJ family transcriptional regulator